MDFSPLQNALASGSYDKIADICDELLLQVSSKGIEFHDDWPYSIHLLGHLFVNDLNSARFLWKTIPNGVKESKEEVGAVWKIGQCLWTKDYAGFYVAVRGFEWSSDVFAIVNALTENYTKRMFHLLLSAYSTISVADTAHFLGMKEDDAVNYALQHGWSFDQSSNMLIVQKPTTAMEQKVDSNKLQRLTEYVFHLEH